MGPIGTAIGLGLKRAGLPNTEIVGTGRDRDRLSKASKMGAVDKASGNLGDAIKGAQLVVLDTGLDETRELLEALAGILEQGAVVTDTATAKALVMRWAADYLPDGVSFVGGRPLPKRELLQQEDAEEGAFEGTYYCVIPPLSTPQDAVKTVLGMVEALGAKPFFLDAGEHDGFTAAMEILPQVLSSALVTSASASESWKEMSRLASHEFRRVSHLAANNPEESHATCLADPDLTVHWLDRFIDELLSYRSKIQQGDDELLDTFIDAWEARTKLELGAVEADDRPDAPTAANSIGSMFLGERLMRRQRQMAERKKRRGWTSSRKRR